jgi:AcrR family transcriptional regulator
MATTMTIRTRLSKQDSQEHALAAAREILIEQGPQAVTLKAVAARIGRTHANVLHHFGSAHGLQTALASSLAERITAKIADAVQAVRRGDLNPRAIVELCFDAFSKEGAGPLASWMILSGDVDALSPILKAIHSLVDELTVPGYKSVANVTLALVLTALGDALLGGPMAEELGLERDTARELAFQQLMAMMGPDYGKRAAA